MNENYNVAVIGAGVVGLSSAISIQKAFPLFNVTIFADKFEEETLSSGAGGLFRPEINVHPNSKRVRKWCSDSLAHFNEIISSSEASASGVRSISGYQLSSTSVHPETDLLREMLPHYQKLNESELETKQFPKQYKKGLFFTSVMADCRYYLPWMKSKFEKAGGKVELKHISSLNDISEKYGIIVNCAGLEAINLVKDDQMMPIRGQTIRVKAPWIKHFYYGDGVYIIPGVDFVTLGGIKDYGSFNLEVNEYQKQFIWDKCIELVPSLKKAEVVQNWVGLRPYRPLFRVDAFFLPTKRNFRMVINNYGHGGHGVALSWGTAQDVTRIIKKELSNKECMVSKL